MTSVTFPDAFLWGTATAAHQVEGGKVNNDRWEMEHAERSPFAEPSGDACDSYHRWREDLDLAADSGLDTYRFSLEWSRIEPEEGEFSRAPSTTTGGSSTAAASGTSRRSSRWSTSRCRLDDARRRLDRREGR